MLETFIANVIKMPIEYQYLDFFGTDSLESGGVVANNQLLESVLNKSTLSLIIEPAILNQLEEQ